MIVLYVILGVVVIFGVVAFRGAPYVPSHPAQVRKAFTELYALNKKDVVLDAGSGDGLVLRIAAKKGARAIGYELNPLLILVSRVWSWRNQRVETRLADFWRVDIPVETTLVYVFSVSRDVAKLERRFVELANKQQRSFHVMMYGAPLPTLSVKGSMGAHTLYEIHPIATRALQSSQP